MKNTLIFIGTILLIIILAGVGLLYGFRQLTSSVVEPIRAANSDMKTQVAAVLHPTPTILRIR